MDIRNAEITSTMLGYEDHRMLTCFIHLNFGGMGQGFGGYAFDEPVKIDNKFSHREPSAYGMDFIKQILDAVGVDTWEELKGKHIRVKHTWSKVYAIGHYLEDKWFYPDNLKEKHFPKESNNG